MSDPDDLLLYGRWIERERKSRHWSQAQLAARAHVSLNTVYLIEAGANSRLSSLLAIVRALNGRLSVLPDVPHIL